MQIVKWSLLLAVFVLSSAAAAEAQWSPEYGGPGGTAPFAVGCDTADHVRQYNVRAGVSIDAIQMACNPGNNAAQNKYSPWYGGTGGTLSTLTCGKFMTGMSVWYDTGLYVNSLRFTCKQQTSAGGATTQSATAGWNLGTFASYSCPTGSALTGMRGRFAALVDRLSVLCQPRPNY